MTETLTLRDVMTSDPVTLPSEACIADAARVMRDKNIGDVIVTRNGSICGIATDRDVVVRAVADGQDPTTTPLGAVCSQSLATVTVETPIEDAISLMRDKAVRRLPVVEDGRAVGIVSIGDLAEVRDPRSALADISSAAPNN